jgi:hypothetical protein
MPRQRAASHAWLLQLRFQLGDLLLRLGYPNPSYGPPSARPNLLQIQRQPREVWSCIKVGDCF